MFKLLDHPLITHKLTHMRKKETGTKDFRENLDEIAELMAYEVCRDLPVKPVEIETPVAPCTGYELSKEVVIVPILRAGIGLLDGIRRLVPTAKYAGICLSNRLKLKLRLLHVQDMNFQKKLLLFRFCVQVLACWMESEDLSQPQR